MRLSIIVALLCGFGASLVAAESGESVIVVYNSAMAESRMVAEHYAERRHVPTNQILGLKLSTDETMSRMEYRENLVKPLLKHLEDNKLFVFEPGAGPSDSKTTTNRWIMQESKIRYAVLCYGVPLKIAEDGTVSEPGSEKLPAPVRRNGAAVDSELCLLSVRDHPLTGPLHNPFYGTTNSAWLTPTNGMLMVARLDGPNANVANGLVDKAIQAETDGLWGRAYFDLRGLTNGEYKLGDDWLAGAAECSRRFGFETVVDVRPETLPASFPLSHVALYAGWYDWNICGPFAQTNVEFMPGAFAYHLQSFSAVSLREPGKHWVGPLLAAGATASIGYVDEPFLTGTTDMAAFFVRFLMQHFSYGEAAYASSPILSWQTTVVGDPLYRPFAKPAQSLHEELMARHSPQLEWSHLRVVNINLSLGTQPGELITYLEGEAITSKSAVLTEKLGDLYQRAGKTDQAIAACKSALKLKPSPQQEVRLNFVLADRLFAAGKEADALAVMDQFIKKHPSYPDALDLYKKLAPLARKLDKKSDAKRYEAEIKRITEAQAKKK